MTAELVPIPAKNLVSELPRIAGHLAVLAEVSHGRLQVVDIVKAVRQRDMQLWAATSDDGDLSLMLTEILNHPRQREAHLISATGQNADRWAFLWPQFEEWARREGCGLISATCRPGWKKLLEPLGFNEVSIVLQKRLA
jgi:hypothetical protein